MTIEDKGEKSLDLTPAISPPFMVYEIGNLNHWGMIENREDFSVTRDY
jgi:hypothetical protein